MGSPFEAPGLHLTRNCPFLGLRGSPFEAPGLYLMALGDPSGGLRVLPGTYSDGRANLNYSSLTLLSCILEP